MFKQDLALNNTQWLICHKIPTKLSPEEKYEPHCSPHYGSNSTTTVL